MKIIFSMLSMAVTIMSGVAIAVDLTPAENKLREQLGESTPIPIRLWPDLPPHFQKEAPPELVEDHARLRGVTLPTISVYSPPPDKNTDFAVIVCPGGGYGGLDWKTHVVYAADVFNRLGVTVVGLKYRTRPPNGVTDEDIQQIALLDVQRAVRVVRHQTSKWGIEKTKIGVAGYSAGGNLTMNLAANFDLGNPQSDDPVERESCRPDFAIGIATWHWRKKESPFHFKRNSPPTFLVHATNDGLNGGAPIELPQAIEKDLKAIGVPVKMAVFDVGAHGVGNLIPQRVQRGFPPAQWPQLFLTWFQELEKTQKK